MTGLVLLLACAQVPVGESAEHQPMAQRGTDTCLACHATLDPGLVSAWKTSAHAIYQIGCASCHGADHAAIFDVQGRVSAGLCAECHGSQYQEFSVSRHADAWRDMERNAMFLAQSPEIQRVTCMPCHAIGRPFPDDSVGQCNYCHVGHTFSAAQARRGDACQTCHRGSNHPQQEAYDSSKHGMLWRATHDRDVAPTCATCHMPDGTHDVGVVISLGAPVHGAVLEGETPPVSGIRTLNRTAFATKRARMLAVCNRCHSSRFARESLTEADDFKREADALLLEARKVIEDLVAEGLLDLTPQDRVQNPVHGHVVILGQDQLFEDTTAIEQRFFELYNFHHATAFKGAYHQAPDLAHWSGLVPMKATLSDIRSEARRLREEARLRASRGLGPRPAIEQYSGGRE